MAWCTAAEATPPVTDGLFIQLDGSNLGDNATRVGIWSDQAINEDDSPTNNHQDFGSVNIGQGNLPDQRPVVLVTQMPGGSSHKTLNFVRGALPDPPVGTNVSGLPTSSRLTSSLNGEVVVLTGDHNDDGRVDAADYVTWRDDPANNGGDQGYIDWRAQFGKISFTAGGDPAYVIGGTPDPDGISWFTVFKNRTVVAPPAGSPLGSQRQNRAIIYGGNYQATAGLTTTSFSEDGGAPGDNVPDAWQNVRTPTLDGVNHLTGNNTGNWYISGMSWNMDTGAVQSRYLREGATTLDLTTDSGIWTESTGTHTQSFMGANSVSATSNNISALDGQIAEVLFYKKALNGTDFDAVMAYLNTKYFAAPAGSQIVGSVPEPAVLVLFCMSALGATLFAIRRRVT